MPSDKVLKYMTLRDADINSKDYEEALLFLTDLVVATNSLAGKTFYFKTKLSFWPKTKIMLKADQCPDIQEKLKEVLRLRSSSKSISILTHY